MDKRISAWWNAHKPTQRRLIQVYAALLYNAHIKGFIQGDIYTGPTKVICVPGFNCYSCPGAIGACPLGALQNALAASGSRAPYYILGILALFGVTLGRTICGWLCPLGLIQELFYKLPTPKLKRSRFTRALSWLKYVVLAIFVIAIPLAYSAQYFPVPGFCKYICPAGTFEGAMVLLSNPANAGTFSVLNILFTRKFIIMVLIFTVCIFLYRAFCRFLCPLGAIYGLSSRLSILGVKVEAADCTHCGKCVAHCKMDVRHVGDHECIHCGECIGVCPKQAISLRCGKFKLMKAEKEAPGEASEEASRAMKTRRIRAAVAWAVALVFLAVMLWYCNRSEQPAEAKPASSDTAAVEQTTAPAETPLSAETQGAVEEGHEPAPAEEGTAAVTAAATAATVAVTAAEEPEIPVGKEVGMRCAPFSVPLYGEGGGDFTLTAGKVNVINFWATYCTPCVGELPYFQRLSDTYGDKIELVAIHAELITDDVEAFLARESYTIPFAHDEDGSVIASFGGSTMLPITVVVDADGTIIYNKVGSITYELLESLVGPLVE